LVALMWVWWLCAAFGAEVQLALDPGTVDVGQSARLQLVITDVGHMRVPQLKVPDGLRLSFRGQSSRSTSTSTGQTRMTIVDYQVQALRVGEYRIGPFALDIAGERLVASEVLLQVKESAAANDAAEVEVNAVFEPAVAWEGQVIRLKYQLRHQVPIMSAAQWDFDDFEGLGQPRDGNQVQRTFQIEGPDGTIDVVERVVPLVAEVAGDRIYRSAMAAVVVQTGKEPVRDRFGRQRIPAERRTLASDPIPLEIKRLPTAPEGYLGLVGEFQVQSNLAQTKVRVGESLRWDLTVSGDGALEGFNLPKLPERDDVRFYDSGTRANARIDESGAYRASGVFTRVVVGTEAGTVQLPPMDLYTFSPEQGAYVAHRVELPAIEVAPGNEGSGEMESFAQGLLGTPVEDPYALRDIRRSGALTTWWPGHQLGWLLSLAGLPGLLVFGRAGVERLASMRAARRKVTLATPMDPRTRLRHLPSDPLDRLAGMDLALRQALARAGGTSLGKLDRERVLAGLPEDLSNGVREVTRVLDRARFAGVETVDVTVDVAPLVAQLMARQPKGQVRRRAAKARPPTWKIAVGAAVVIFAMVFLAMANVAMLGASVASQAVPQQELP
jgi:hypothetical protein